MGRAFSRSKTNPLYKLGPLYHEYSLFGVKNEQLPGIFSANQKAKAPIISAYIALAIAKAKEKHDNGQVDFAELFCADGYYTMLASRLGVSKAVGYDNDSDENGFFKKAPEIARILSMTNVQFMNEDMQEMEKLPRYSIVANIGGLYHVSNPEEILKKSYNMAKDYLIVQSVVSMANSRPDYFESPAPGWTWGSRFNKVSFDKLIKRLKYRVVDSHFNELKGNPQKSNRGSVYYLIEK
jgi:hypothetical protein